MVPPRPPSPSHTHTHIRCRLHLRPRHRPLRQSSVSGLQSNQWHYTYLPDSDLISGWDNGTLSTVRTYEPNRNLITYLGRCIGSVSPMGWGKTRRLSRKLIAGRTDVVPTHRSKRPRAGQKGDSVNFGPPTKLMLLCCCFVMGCATTQRKSDQVASPFQTGLGQWSVAIRLNKDGDQYTIVRVLDTGRSWQEGPIQVLNSEVDTMVIDSEQSIYLYDSKRRRLRIHSLRASGGASLQEYSDVDIERIGMPAALREAIRVTSDVGVIH
jgi:hypothetical protein